MEAIALQPEQKVNKIDGLGRFIGNTPLFSIRNLNKNPNVELYAKLEWQQFGHSVKSRPAYQIIHDGLQSGELTPDKHILDATSGNTGIAYAHIGAALGIQVTLFMPENASKERKNILKALGVDLRYTSASGGTDEAQQAAIDHNKAYPERYFYADQYDNPSNWKAHYKRTGPEVIDQTDNRVTHFVAGKGTTGTFTGTGKYLKSIRKDIKVIGLQPDTAIHGMEGWKHLETARMPAIHQPETGDEELQVSTELAYDTLKDAAKYEGLLLSPSSAANLGGALQVAHDLDEGVVVTVFPDDASKYSEILKQLMEI